MGTALYCMQKYEEYATIAYLEHHFLPSYTFLIPLKCSDGAAALCRCSVADIVVWSNQRTATFVAFPSITTR